MDDILKIGCNAQALLSRRIRAELRRQEDDELPLTVDEDAIVFRRKARPFAEYPETLDRTSSGRSRT